jgi:hypothetical protein
LFVGLMIACSALALGTGTASADPIPHTVCAGGNGTSTFNPPLTLVPESTDFSATSSLNACVGAFVGTVEVTSLKGSGILSCELSVVGQGDFTLKWDGNEDTTSSGTVETATNISKGIVFLLLINNGMFAGQQATLTVQSLGDTLNCASGLAMIQGPTQLVFGV